MAIAEGAKPQEVIALLVLLALGRKDYEEGKFSDAEIFFDEQCD